MRSNSERTAPPAEGRILFLGNDASRSGAPLVLLRFLQWLRERTPVQAELLLRNGGPLQERYARLFPTRCMRDLDAPRSVFQRIVNRFGFTYEARSSAQRKVRALYGRNAFDLVYSNTVTNGGLLDLLAGMPCPVLCHVHEMESLVRKYGTENIEAVKRRTTHYVAVSGPVKRSLVETHGIPSDRVTVLPAFVPVSEIAGRRPAGVLRKQFGIPPDALIVGASGGPNWTKGRDLFVQLAVVTRALRPPRAVHFVWVGGRPGPDLRETQHDVQRAGVADCVHVVDRVDDPLGLYADFDVLALTSREDSCPLVVLEAACLGKPILCFSGSGGAPDFVEDDAGFVLPYLDVRGMAEKGVMLGADESLRRKLGERAARKAAERHDVSCVAPRVLEVAARLMRG